MSDSETAMCGYQLFGKKAVCAAVEERTAVLDKKKIAEESRYDGKYVLLTTDRELDACELASQFWH